MFHRSDRLLLRPVWPEDVQALLAGIADEGVVRNLARAPWPYHEDDARAFAALPVDPFHPRFMITHARDGQAVGCVGIDPAGAPGTVELGYWIARRFWGQGFATEAGLAALAIAAALGHSAAIAAHFLDNPASAKVLRKLGFEPTGRIEERFSCGRGCAAQAVQYRRLLDTAVAQQRRAA